MDLLSFAVTHALFFASASYNYTESPTINWTEFDSNRWWGPTSKQASQDTAIYPTNITFSNEMITDLRSRLDSPRNWTKPLEGIAFQYGFNNDQVNSWTTFWSKQYNFTDRLIKYNQYPMYKTNIQGLDIFYIRVTPKVTEGVEIVPMLLLHGWPGSIFEFFDVIPLLTAVSSDRNFAIELIIPSLPGFGFSQAAVRPGLGAAQMAVIMRNLMNRIGYKKYYVQGGDFGALINGHLATLYPEEVLGYHTNWGVVLSPVAIFLQMVGTLYPPLVIEQRLMSRMYPITNRFTALLTATGYMHIQATKPDTIGAVLTDSPAGLMAYLFEKYATAVNKSNLIVPNGGLFEYYEPSFLIDTLMYYWSTSSIQTAMRIYSETFNKHHFGLRMEEIPTHVPTYLLQAADEFTYQSPIILGLKYKNILEAEVLDVGGHFLAHERPKPFTESVFKGLTKFRAYHACVAASGNTSTNTTNLECVVQVSDTTPKVCSTSS